MYLHINPSPTHHRVHATILLLILFNVYHRTVLLIIYYYRSARNYFTFLSNTLRIVFCCSFRMAKTSYSSEKKNRIQSKRIFYFFRRTVPIGSIYAR
jgi:hypothetical protein